MGSAAGSHRAEYDHQPEFVDLVYDESALKTYRPLLVTGHLEIEPTRLFAWIARSAERDTDMYCYWAWYAGQQGITADDSHVPDREPFYVEVRPGEGVERVIYDRLHYTIGTDLSPPTTDDTRPTYRVIKPWHPYEPTSTLGVDVSLASMHSVYSEWLDNEWTVHQPSVVNPWTVVSRGHWWPDGTFGIQTKDDIADFTIWMRETVGISIPIPGRET